MGVGRGHACVSQTGARNGDIPYTAQILIWIGTIRIPRDESMLQTRSHELELSENLSTSSRLFLKGLPTK